MSMHGVEPHFDGELGLWEIGARPPGPAGAARLVLSPGLEVLVDVADNALGLVLLEDEDTGRIRTEDLIAAAVLVGSEQIERAAGGRALPSADPGQAALIARAALALDRLDLARADDVRNLWAAELSSLAARADVRIPMQSALDPFRAAIRDGTPELERFEANPGSSGTTRRAPDLELIEVARPRLTSAADGRSLVGTVVLDDALTPRGVLALDRPADLRWDRIDRTLSVSCPVGPRAYPPEVGAQWARVYRPDSRVLLALGSLDPSSPGTAGVELLLGPMDDDAVGNLRIDVTPDPAARPPSDGLRRGEAAARYGRAAVSAERLGLPQAADDAWHRCADAWASIGDESRARQALADADTATDRTARAEEPFLVEVLEAERVDG